ncbi:MAG: sigma-70 family RNA polymerase sigma factor [Syntrophomonadaceae bacterium]|nr:sigma-70 family RNA polymerase sigma factor [Syntrophomonadaceae bacterium]
MDLDRLWLQYRRSKDEEARQQLLIHYLHLVKLAAGRLYVKMPVHLDREDLASFGVFGLLDALEKFDPARGVKFETYAYQRIRGAIIDELRAAHWAPRSAADRWRRLAEVSAEEAEALSPDETIASQVGFLSTVSLEKFFFDDQEGLRHADLVADPASPNPEAIYEERELLADLTKAVALLPDKDRLVLSLYYYEGLTLKEIGQVLEVSESRVCQLHARALLRLRQLLQD